MSSWKKKLVSLFRPGRMPDSVIGELESEGVLLLVERVRLAVIYRNFQAPGKRFLYKREGGIGSFALSGRRVVALSSYKKVIDVVYVDPRFKMITFKSEKDKYLSALFDSSVFDSTQSGNVELRFYLPDVARAMGLLKIRGA